MTVDFRLEPALDLSFSDNSDKHYECRDDAFGRTPRLAVTRSISVADDIRCDTHRDGTSSRESVLTMTISV